MYKLHFGKVGKPAGNVHGHWGQLVRSQLDQKKQAMYTLTYEIQTQTTVIYHYREQSLEGSFFSAIWSNISKTSASVSSGFQTRENWWKHEAAGRVLLLFSSVWNPDETRSTSFWNYFSNKRKLV